MFSFVYYKIETNQLYYANDIRNDSYFQTAWISLLKSIVISNFLTFYLLSLHLVQYI